MRCSTTLQSILEKKDFDIFGPFGGFVVQQEGVFPYVHYQDRAKTRRVAVFVQGNPVVGEPARERVLEGDGPTHTAHRADFNEIVLPVVKSAKASYR